MVPAREILGYLSAATTWASPIATGWHVALGLLISLLAIGWRPRSRLLGVALLAPLISVSVVAILGGNPFNAVVFALLAAGLAASTRRGQTHVRIASAPWVAIAALLLLFAWAYPHFTTDGSWTQYLYRTPLGTIPCPTLAALLGIALCAEGLGRPWERLASSAALFYGVVGVAYLGVMVDLLLLAGATALLLKPALTRRPMVVGTVPM